MLTLLLISCMAIAAKATSSSVIISSALALTIPNSIIDEMAMDYMPLPSVFSESDSMFSVTEPSVTEELSMPTFTWSEISMASTVPTVTESATMVSAVPTEVVTAPATMVASAVPTAVVTAPVTMVASAVATESATNVFSAVPVDSLHLSALEDAISLANSAHPTSGLAMTDVFKGVSTLLSSSVMDAINTASFLTVPSSIMASTAN